MQMNREDDRYGRIVQRQAGAGNAMGGFMWLLAEMIRLPLTAFVSTIEVFITSLRGIQRATDQVIDVTAGGMTEIGDYKWRSETPSGGSSDTWKVGASMVSVEAKTQQSQKEQSEMDDRDIDLRGDDLKLVEYDVWFTKSDLEAYLAEDKEVVAYSTTLGDFKGARITKYLRELRTEPGKRSQKWLDNEYPPPEYRSDEDGNQQDDGAYFIGLPQDDVDEYLKVDVRLKGRRSRDEKDESDRLKDINKTLKGTIKVRQVP